MKAVGVLGLTLIGPLGALIGPLGGAGGAPPTLKPLGVCDVQPEGVACWSLGGGRDPELAAEVEARILKTKMPISVVPGLKNRFVAVRSEPLAWISVVDPPKAQAIFLHDEDRPLMLLLRVPADPRAERGTVTAQVGLLQGEAVDLAVKPGAKAKVGEVHLELGPVRNDVRRYADLAFFRGPWTYSIERSPASEGQSFEAVGHDGKPIRFVDGSGKPIETAKAETWIREDMAANQAALNSRAGRPLEWKPPRAKYASIRLEPGNEPLSQLQMNVDPKAIRSFRVRRIASHEETIGPFELDALGR